MQEHYLKMAAKKGIVQARHNLGCIENMKGNTGIAAKHWVMSAAAGHDDSLKAVQFCYRAKVATKDQYEGAIRANKKAKEEMSSEERGRAKAAGGLQHRY